MLKRTLTEEEFNGLHESIREDYTATETDDDTVYHLQVEGMVSDDDVDGLRSALDKERTNVAEQKRKRQELEGQRTAAEERLAALQAEKDGEITSLTEQLAQRENQEAGRRDKLLSKMGKVLLDKAAIDAIAAHDGNITLLLPKLQQELDVEIDNESSVRIKAKDAKGDDGKPLTAHQLVAEMRKNPTFWGAFKGSGSSGGGMPPAGGGSRAPKTATPRRSAMSPRQKVEYVKEHGNEAFLSLPR